MLYPAWYACVPSVAQQVEQSQMLCWEHPGRRHKCREHSWKG